VPNGRTQRHSRISSLNWLHLCQDSEECRTRHSSSADSWLGEMGFISSAGRRLENGSEAERENESASTRDNGVGRRGEETLTTTAAATANPAHQSTTQQDVVLNNRQTTALSDRKKEFWIIFFILTPAIVVTFILLSMHWNDGPGCVSPLRLWCLVEAIRLLVSVTLSWILQRDIERTPEHTASLDQIGRVVSFFSLSWFVIGQIWLVEGIRSCDGTPMLVHLTAALIILQYTLMLLPIIVLLILMPFLCLFLPCIIQGFFFFNRSNVRGASKREINKIPIEKFSRAEFAEKGFDENCSICLADFETSEITRILRCKHVYHKECIDSWLTLNGTCPICRSEVSRKRSQPFRESSSEGGGPISRSDSHVSATSPRSGSSIELNTLEPGTSIVSDASASSSMARPTAGDRVAAQSVLYRRIFSFRSLFARQRGLPTIRTPGEPLSSLRNLRDAHDAEVTHRRRSAEGSNFILPSGSGTTAASGTAATNSNMRMETPNSTLGPV